MPAYLLDRADEKQAKILSNMVKQKRKEKAEKYSVPLPRVRGISEEEIFKVIKTGKSKKKSWKRLITKATFVGEGFTRKPVKYEVKIFLLLFKKYLIFLKRFIRFFAFIFLIHVSCIKTYGSSAKESKCYSSKACCNYAVSNSWCKKKSSISYVYTTGCSHKGNGILKENV